jgi:hypothetical protein
MANKERGEVEVSLNGSTYIMRPTHNVITEIESRLGIGIFRVASRLRMADYWFTDISVIICEGIKGGVLDPKEALSQDDVSRMIAEKGLDDYIQPTIQLISQMITSKDSGGKKKTRATLGDKP